MDRSAVAGEPTRPDSCVEIAASNLKLQGESRQGESRQGESRVELEVWEDEGGTINQPLASNLSPAVTDRA